MKKETEYIIQLIVKRLQGGLSPEEETFFTAWKSRSKANEELYERLENEYEEHTEYPLYEQFNARRSWPSVMKDIRKRHSIRRLYRGVAAAAIVLLSVSSYLMFSTGGEKVLPVARVESGNHFSFGKRASLILPGGDTLLIAPGVADTLDEQLPFVSNNGETLIYHTPRTADSLVYNTLKIPRGGAYSLQLSDGTKVMLNSDSRLKFPQSFSGDTREVYLEGEGFFQVAKDAGKPFIVHCEKYAVRVLGTTFNISAYRNDEVSMTTLVEGRVNIECGNTVVALTPGLMAAVADSKVTTREVNVESYISWTRDQFSFSEERLEDLLKKISRWYDVEFVFDDEEIKDYKFSGFMPRYESIDAILQIMEQAANVTFKMNNKQIVVYTHQE